MFKKKEIILDKNVISWIGEKIDSSESAQVIIYIEDRKISHIRFLSNERFKETFQAG